MKSLKLLFVTFVSLAYYLFVMLILFLFQAMIMSIGSFSGDVGFAGVNLQVNLLAISLAVISETLALRRYMPGILTIIIE